MTEGIRTHEYKLTIGKTDTAGTFWISLTNQNNETEKINTTEGFFGREEAKKMIELLQQWLAEDDQ